MVSRHDAALAAIPLSAGVGGVAGWATDTSLLTVLGLLGAALVIAHELFVVGVPE